MGKLIPTADELKLLLALRRHSNRDTQIILINVKTFIIWPLGMGEIINPARQATKESLDKNVVTA